MKVVVFQNFNKKTTEKKPLEMPRRRWNASIKIDRRKWVSI